MKRFWKIVLVLLLIFVTAVVTFLGTWGYVTDLYENRSVSSPVAAKVEELHSYLDYYFIDDYDVGAAAAAACGIRCTAAGRQSEYCRAGKAQCVR